VAGALRQAVRAEKVAPRFVINGGGALQDATG
jgi:hypothetical protein